MSKRVPEKPKKQNRKNKGHANLIPAKKGEVRNPNGRPKGSRNKLGELFLQDLQREWEKGGAKALETVRLTDPAVFIRVAASVLPKEININQENRALEDFLDKFQTIEEIDAFIAGVTHIGADNGSAKKKTKAAAGKQSDILH